MHAKKKRGSAEVHIDDIDAYILFRLFGLDRISMNDLIENKSCAELGLCRTNRAMLQQYLELRRAAIASDSSPTPTSSF